MTLYNQTFCLMNQHLLLCQSNTKIISICRIFLLVFHPYKAQAVLMDSLIVMTDNTLRIVGTISRRGRTYVT